MRCKTCNSYVLPASSDKHECPPLWRVWENGPAATINDGQPIYASEPEWAVQQWAEEMDGGNDMFITNAGDEGVEVCVADDRGEVGIWRVFGEPTIDYTVKEVI